MSVTSAVALLALLVSLFTLVALVAVHARVRALEAGSAAGLTGYPTLVGRPAPAAVRPGPGDRCALVAVLDGDCALCRTVLAEFAALPEGTGVRVVAVTDRAPGSPDAGLAGTSAAATLCTDPAVRADLFEGYAPTLLAVGPAGTVVARRFVYADTDVPALLRELVQRASSDTSPVASA